MIDSNRYAKQYGSMSAPAYQYFISYIVIITKYQLLLPFNDKYAYIYYINNDKFV